MRTTRVIIGDHFYTVHPSEDPSRVRSNAFDAAAAGVGLFEFVAADGRWVRVVVSPGVPIIFEDIEMSAQIPASADFLFSSSDDVHVG